MAPAALKVFLDGGLGGDSAVASTHRSDRLGPNHGQETALKAPSSTGLGTASLRLALWEVGAGLRVESGVGRGTRACISVRSAEAEGDLIILIDGDPRRARSRIDGLSRGALAKTWLFHSPTGALGTIRAGRAAAALCVDTVRPDLRAELAQVRCRRRLPPLDAPVRARHSDQRRADRGANPSPVGTA